METPRRCCECGVELTDGVMNAFCSGCLVRIAWNSALHRLGDEYCIKGKQTQAEAIQAVVAGVNLGRISTDLATWIEIGVNRTEMATWRLRMRLVELWIEELVEKLEHVEDDEL